MDLKLGWNCGDIEVVGKVLIHGVFHFLLKYTIAHPLLILAL